MERLSFISGSSANEDEDGSEDDEDEEEDPMAVLLPPPPLPPKPSILLNQQVNRFALGSQATVAEPSSLIPSAAFMSQCRPLHYEDSDVGTVRRKAKRDRNRTAVLETSNKDLTPLPPAMITDIGLKQGLRGCSSSSASKSRYTPL
jgi:hypothetical protein